MMWAFGNSQTTDEARTIMTRNLRGEFSDRRTVETYHND